MPTLTGTGRVADDLYLLAHDDDSGRPFLQPRALGVGLAGALLAELMFAGAIWIQSGLIEFTSQESPEDDIGRQVLSVLMAEPDWHRCGTGSRSWPGPPARTWPGAWNGPVT